MQFPKFEIVDPLMRITKMGAGSRLYVIAEDEVGLHIVPAGNLSFDKVAEMIEREVQFIEF